MQKCRELLYFCTGDSLLLLCWQHVASYMCACLIWLILRALDHFAGAREASGMEVCEELGCSEGGERRIVSVIVVCLSKCHYNLE